MAGSFVSRRLSEFIGVALFAMALMMADFARELQPGRSRSGSLRPASRSRAGQLRRSRWSVSRRAVVPAARIHRLPAAHRARRQRLALLLVPRARRRLHEARRARPALRVRLVVSVARVRHASRGEPRDARRRLARQMAGVLPRRVPQQDRIDHPDPDAAVSLDRPLHAVLVRPALRRALPAGPRSLVAAMLETCERDRKRRRREQQRQEVLKKHLDKTGERHEGCKGRRSLAPNDDEEDDQRLSDSPAVQSEGSSNEGGYAGGGRQAVTRRRRCRRRRGGTASGCLPADSASDQASSGRDRTDASVVGSREGPGREETQRRLRPAAAGAARRSAVASERSTSGS